MAEIEEQSAAKEKKPRRAYHKKPEPPPPPAPPSPTILAFEQQVLHLVDERLAANSEIANALAASNEAQSRLQVAQTRLKQIESEVQYRMALIAQMKGGAPTQIHGPSLTTANTWAENMYVGPIDSGYGVSVPTGVSSIPAPRIVPSEPRIRGPRTESAEGVRAEAVGMQAVI